MTIAPIEGLSRAPRVLVHKLGLAPLLRRILRRGPLSPVFARGRRQGWDAAVEWLLTDAGRPVLRAPAFHEALRADSNFDVQMEQLLVALRRRLLAMGDGIGGDALLEDTVVTLATQALNNGYVWVVSGEERAAIERWQQRVVEQSSSAAGPEWLAVALLCMYARPDEILPFGTDAAYSMHQVRIPHEAFRHFVETYAAEHERKSALRASLESFGAITRPVSKAISENYAVHPYPRWVRLRETSLVPDRAELATMFTQEELAFLDGPFRLLEAGCGTGYGVVPCAISNQQARITAVDFSTTSLGYAALMAERHGVSNVRFLRMDLLDLPQLDETFDMVRCIGVLHHMESPTEGGRALVSRLRSGGIVHISLYSRLSRRELARLREKYALVPGMSDDAVREVRYRILTEETETIDDRLPLRADFFDLDRCRDLLFHPLEHTFTVPMIRALLDDLGLEFRGLGRPGISPSQLWADYPSPKAWRDWEAWEAFEGWNPDAFGGLYQIYARKP